MKVRVEIDLEDLYNGEESVSEMIRQSVIYAIRSGLKKHPDYKKFIDASVESALKAYVEMRGDK